MKHFKMAGFTMAMVLLTNGAVIAGESYQPAEYLPKVDYADPQSSLKAVESAKVAEVVEPRRLKLKKIQQAEIQAQAALAEVSEGGSKLVESAPAPMASPQSEKVTSSNGGILPIVVVLVGLGLFLYKKKSVKTGTASVSAMVSVEPSEGSTGVERYIDRLGKPEKTGVEKYLEKRAEVAPATGVAKYLARRAARDRA